MATPFRTLALLLLVLTAPVALAADKQPWYQVEIIVFSRAGTGTEHWPTEPAPIPVGRELVPWRGFTGPDSVPFQKLPATALLMNKDFERMKAAPDVHPVLHVGWIQPGLAREEAVAVRIASEPDNAGWVDGNIRLVLSRFLHLEANILFHRHAEGSGGAVFQLIESRRMRSKEYHYLDHPAFGVIALVTPYEGKGGSK